MSIKFNWVQNKRTNGRRIDKAGIVLYKSGGNKKDRVQDRSTLVISEQIMRKARFVIGDKVEVGFGVDEKGNRGIAIKRVISEGYSIVYASGSQKGMADKLKGQTLRGRLQFARTPDVFDSFKSEHDLCEIDESGNLICWESYNEQS